MSLRVYPVGSQPAQATPIFSYDVAVRSVGSQVSVQFEAQPAIVNGELRTGERGELAIPGTQPSPFNLLSPQLVRDSVARRYQAVMEAQGARGQT